MMLYKPDCDSNDYELPNEKVTPSILAIEVWLVRLHVGWAINRMPYYSSDSCAWLGVGRLTEESTTTHSRQLYMQLYIYTASRLNMREIENTCMFAIASMHVLAKGVWSHNIIHCIFFFL